jgi:hypothetical protein
MNERLARDGFAIGLNLLDDDDAAALIDGLSSIGSANTRGHGEVYAIRNLLDVPAVRALAESAAVRALVEPLLGRCTSTRAAQRTAPCGSSPARTAMASCPVTRSATGASPFRQSLARCRAAARCWCARSCCTPPRPRSTLATAASSTWSSPPICCPAGSSGMRRVPGTDGSSSSPTRRAASRRTAIHILAYRLLATRRIIGL